jgi:hypothetical protein
MNTFTGLKPGEGENTDIPEITNEKQKKKYAKKLKQKRERVEKCDCEKTKEKLSEEIRIIQIEIEEYENRGKGIPAKKDKTKPKTAEGFVFDEAEIRKFNAKRKRENEEKAKKEWEEKKKREEEAREYWDNWDKRSKSWDNERKRSKRNYKWIPDENEDDNKGPVDLKSFIEDFNMKLKDVPKDIMNLNHKFSLEDFKQLSRKYHPDKSDKQEYMYILNKIRDHYIKREVKNDETWTK